ncbi:hypothetical protein SUGI_0638950 [Cryptomeria japonica]|uniref:uncharacterized protein At1g76070-like n=1 Tax=Cryptomeria japonica TaxID=3369 RepID=UPI002414C93F|nr:uncharacterized protein At1g76070-like [Cryptomeria japonica]GLJ31763.1 hypothetical protein SUGI_0638950 [Cryptomeria japonica]
MAIFTRCMKVDKKDEKNFEDSDKLHLRSRSSKESQSASSNPVLACLPKMSSIISGYHMASVSPGRVEYGCRANRAGGIRRPISLIPKEAMEKKNDHRFEPQEPTSPKVSCTGQVKKIKQAKQILMRSQDRPPLSSQTRPLLSPPGGKFSKMKSFFSGKKVTESALCESPDQIAVNNCPSLGQMKRFSSARHCDALANVWTEIHNN